jgi:hypothetical protein
MNADIMNYELPAKITGYFPEVLSILTSIEDSAVFHGDHNLSHPGDLFLLTFNDVIECAHRLAMRVNCEVENSRITHHIDDEKVDGIRIEVFNLLFYCANFIESCQSIIKSLFKDGSKDKAFTRAVREFVDNTRSYREHTSKIINLIKHQHRRIRPFSFSWENNLIFGYFVEGLLAPNVLGPDPQVHQKYNSLNTGISINRDIPYHLVNIYFASACLASVIKKYVKITNKPQINLPSDHVVKCLEEVSKLEFILLPDEFAKELPVITNKNEGKFCLEMPSKKTPHNAKPHLATVSLNMKIGISNRSFAPPYMLPQNG